jgi:hypothetical protein
MIVNDDVVEAAVDHLASFCVTFKRAADSDAEERS